MKMKREKITKASLDKLSKTMQVITDSEMEKYFGLYDNDCFWRCVSYLKGTGTNESAASNWANGWFFSEDGMNGLYQLSITNDSGIPRTDMRRFLEANNMLVGSNDNNRIVGLLHTTDLEYYRNNSNIPAYQNHNLILKSVNSNGTCEMYDPQHNVSFTVSSSESKKFIPINYGSY